MCKEASLAQFKALFKNLPEGPEKLVDNELGYVSCLEIRTEYLPNMSEALPH
jgi:hypothetical protein